MYIYIFIYIYIYIYINFMMLLCWSEINKINKNAKLKHFHDTIQNKHFLINSFVQKIRQLEINLIGLR